MRMQQLVEVMWSEDPTALSGPLWTFRITFVQGSYISQRRATCPSSQTQSISRLLLGASLARGSER